ncbi:uncharacterized protein DS421_17g596500 [Arachis hypogaea]|nr:uncharacterized protein DS421_17g596500 [Arachis hypogaea]
MKKKKVMGLGHQTKLASARKSNNRSNSFIPIRGRIKRKIFLLVFGKLRKTFSHHILGSLAS